MVSPMSCYMHCSSKMWVCLNNITFCLCTISLSLSHLFLCPHILSILKLLLSVSRSFTTPLFSRARPFISLFPTKSFWNVFPSLDSSLLDSPATMTYFRPILCLCFYRSLLPEKCWVHCLMSSAPCAWMPVVCTHLCNANPLSGCSRCCSRQTTCQPCAVDAALTH